MMFTNSFNEQKDYYSVCFNMVKMRYSQFDQIVDGMNYLCPTDNINVFINFEMILKFLTGIKDVDSKVQLNPNFDTIIISNMLNLAAHYKRFFVGNNLHTRVFLYMTDLSSTKFKEYELYEDYRSYYLMKYKNNPKYECMMHIFKEKIFPQAKVIFGFIPDVYFVEGKDMDGSLIPLVIGNQDLSYKNFIITSDILETQYNQYPNFSVFLMKRNPTNQSTTYNLQGYLESGFRLRITEENIASYLSLYQNRAFYLALLASYGEKYRCIDRVSDLTPLRVTKCLSDGLYNHVIQPTTESMDLISKVLPPQVRDEFLESFALIDFSYKEKKMSKEDIYNIQSQLVDRFDNNSLLELNRTKFVNNQLMLEELTQQFTR